MFSVTLTGRVVDLATVLVLGNVLLEEHWGLIGIATAVRVFTDLLGRIGLDQVLVQRHAKFQRWATPGWPW